MENKQNVTLAIRQFVPNCLSYVSAKYYLNRFIVGKVITKIKGVNFLLRQCIRNVNTLYTHAKRYTVGLLQTIYRNSERSMTYSNADHSNDRLRKTSRLFQHLFIK